MPSGAEIPSLAPSAPLSELINNATKHQHTALNRLISSRLPLCLPPHAAQPDAYLIGITQIAEIFLAFESVWDDITSLSQVPSLENTWDSLETYPHPLSQSRGVDDPLISALRTLRPMGIARSSRLKNDLEYLRCVCGIPEDDARCAAADAIKAHVDSQVRSKPHLLIAYAWTMYLAVFSGGRYIRSLLCDAGEDFWLGRHESPAATETSSQAEKKSSGWNWRSPVARLSSSSTKAGTESKSRSKQPKTVDELRSFEAKGLSLWFFPGPNDGEELRAEFKQRLRELEPLLSVEQELEIVSEAQAVFSRVEALVSELDLAISASTAPQMPPTFDAQPAGHDDASVEAADLSYQPQKTAPAANTSSSSSPSVPAPVTASHQRWFELPSYAGIAMVICGISYVAMYYGGTWDR
ncbi:uncharacterized protein PV09_05225 [Verruconis gallopava]|uniref:Heme oxygenase-like protein n=1 Tax=Verruconis gallopava TaxID=253628 RepID=A0A0D1XM20_9PEZI|nr:uncharacterized protein PV09_05225 [Verruconis gallopava]KIW03456.1 hypothetical protein PV09_05225 [Verruconis gallopava]